MPEPSLGELECVTRSNHVCPIRVVSRARNSQTFFSNVLDERPQGLGVGEVRGMLSSWVLGPRLPGAFVMGSVSPVGSCSPSARSLLSPGTGCPSQCCVMGSRDSPLVLRYHLFEPKEMCTPVL